MSWVFLSIAIVSSVVATLALRLVAQGDRRWLLPTIVGFMVSFVMLSFTLRAGMPLGIAYGIWTAVGVAVIALAGRVLFDEPFGRLSVLGLACIAGGVVLVEFGQ